MWPYSTWKNSACSANSSINRPSPHHSNAYYQIPPVQNGILPFAYLSNRWWILLNAYIKASNNLHRKTKDDWWPRSNISKCYCFLKNVLSFSMPQLNFPKTEMPRTLLSITANFGCSSYKNHQPARIWVYFMPYYTVVPMQTWGNVGMEKWTQGVEA